MRVRINITCEESVLERLDVLASLRRSDRSSEIENIVSAHLEEYISLARAMADPARRDKLLKQASELFETHPEREFERRREAEGLHEKPEDEHIVDRLVELGPNRAAPLVREGTAKKVKGKK